MTYGTSHKIFLQTMISHGILGSKEVREAYKVALAAENKPVDDKLVQFVQEINMKIKPHQLEIRKALCEDTGSPFYVLVNMEDSSVSRLASRFSANELEIFKKLVEWVMESAVGSVSSMEALNKVVSIESLSKKMSKSEAQSIIDKFVEDKWLKMVEGRISLSTRTICEMTPYLQQQFAEIAVKCRLCKTLCIKGQACASCDVKIHAPCASRFYKDHAMTCIKCKAPWPHPVADLRALAREGADGGSQCERVNDSQPSTSQRLTGRRSQRLS